jgi:hypothetical protein
MNQTPLRIVLSFTAEDQAWIRQSKAVVPPFWQGHQVAPAQGDVVRIAGRQFVIQGRVWEHDGESPVLKLIVGDAHAQSDTVFG